jgi:RNA-directed DNA polymerase
MTQYKSEMWKRLPWKQFRKDTFRIQKRIYEASRNNNIPRVLYLQKLLFRSYGARMLAIRQVTQLNSGKKTAGIDGKSSLTIEQRFLLEQELLREGMNWNHMGLRITDIPKPDGSLRTLKIPTIRDRAWQCLAKFVVEPAHEAKFHAHSYGFRPGRGTHDAQKVIFCNLKSRVNGRSKRILELDIEKCFDRINHSTIMDNIIAPGFLKSGLHKCLKIGVNPEFPDQGTPQGGVISPLLANIALNGIEDIHPSIRYADDMIYFLKPHDNEDVILSKITQFLITRGMNIKDKKTKVTRSIDGFDFLGWHFVNTVSGKFICRPSKNNYTNFKKKIRNIIQNSAIKITGRITKIATIVRGWRNYHKYCDMSKHELWPLNRYVYNKIKNRKTKISYDESIKLIRRAFPYIGYQINKFVNVKHDRSPFDGDLIYWSKRKSQLYDGSTYRLLLKQSFTCNYCNLKFNDNEDVHLHHIDGNHNNWMPYNVCIVHKSCHQYLH